MRIAVVGAVAVDKYVIVEHFPEDDDMVFALRSFQSVGGCGANIAINLALNGMDVDLFCGLGCDDTADRIAAILRELGIRIFSRQCGKTARTIILLDKKGRRRIISLGGNALFESSNELKYEGYDAICVADSYPSEALKVIRNDCRIKVYAPGGCGLYFGENEIRKIAALACVTILSNREASQINQYNLLSQYVVVTHGEKPTKLYYNGKLVREFMVKCLQNVVDTTGAGDAFVSGILFSLTLGQDIYSAIEVGHLWASRVIQKYGANLLDYMEGFPNEITQG